MASKESSLLVLTTSPCVDTGDVGWLLWAVVFDPILSVMFDKKAHNEDVRQTSPNFES